MESETLQFSADLIEWRGPAPFFFAPLDDLSVHKVRDLASIASYGWGCIPVVAEISGTRFTTSLFPRGDGYLLPVKAAVRKEAGITNGDYVKVDLAVSLPDPFKEPDLL